MVFRDAKPPSIEHSNTLHIAPQNQLQNRSLAAGHTSYVLGQI
jgi:hypothetical protein